MGLLDWAKAFVTGDTVKTRYGVTGKVIRHEADGYVIIRDKNGKYHEEFGGNVEPVDDDFNPDDYLY